jgi:MFS family permease
MKEMLHTSRIPEIWRHRDLRWVAVGRAVSTLGDEVALVALLVHLFMTGARTAGVSALLVAAALPAVLLAPWAGRLVDRTDSRWLLVSTGVLQAIACGAVAWVLVADAALWVLLAAVIALQSLQVVAGPAWQVLVPTIVGDADTGKALGALQPVVLMAGIFGPALGGLVVGLWSPAVALSVDAVSFLILALGALRIQARRRPDRSAHDESPRLLDGLRSIGADRLLLPLFVGLMAFVVAGEMTNVVEVFLVQGVLDGSPLVFGVLGGLFACGAVVGSVLGGRAVDDSQRATWATGSAAVLAMGLILGGLAPSLVVFGVLWAAGGVALGVLNVVVMTLVIVRTQQARRGLVIASVNGLSRGFSLLATLLGGALGALVGPRMTFVMAGVAALAVTAGMGMRVRRAARAEPTAARPQRQVVAT